MEFGCVTRAASQCEGCGAGGNDRGLDPPPGQHLAQDAAIDGICRSTKEDPKLSSRKFLNLKLTASNRWMVRP